MASELPPFTGETSQCIDTWLNQFSAIANLGIPDGTAARLLMLKLGGEARTYAESLTAAQQNHYTQLLQELLQEQYHGAIHVNAARAQLRQEKWRVDDSPAKMYGRLQPLILKIYANFGRGKRCSTETSLVGEITRSGSTFGDGTSI